MIQNVHSGIMSRSFIIIVTRHEWTSRYTTEPFTVTKATLERYQAFVGGGLGSTPRIGEVLFCIYHFTIDVWCRRRTEKCMMSGLWSHCRSTLHVSVHLISVIVSEKLALSSMASTLWSNDIGALSIPTTSAP